MKFNNSFYSIQGQEITASEANFDVIINGEHAIFEGHFPGQPIAPGVMQMEMIKELTSMIYNREVVLQSMSNCKFLAFINPNEKSDFSITIKHEELEDNSIKVAAIISGVDTNYLKLNAVYQ